MAEIFLKNVDNTLILEPREYMLRPFNFGAWTEIRMGIYFGMVALTNDTDSSPEDIAVASYLDYITFGIKDSSTVLPGTTGSLFLGAITSATQDSVIQDRTGGVYRIQSAVGTGGQYLSACGYYDTNLVLGTTSDTLLSVMEYPQVITGTTGYCAFQGLRFVITGLGLSTQTVTVSSAFLEPVTGNAYTVANLRTLLTNSTYSTGRVVTWNTGAAARAIPTCWWLRMPFLNNRIRVSAMDMIKIS